MSEGEIHTHAVGKALKLDTNCNQWWRGGGGRREEENDGGAGGVEGIGESGRAVRERSKVSLNLKD